MLPFFLLIASATAQVSMPAQDVAAAPAYAPRALAASGDKLKGKLIQLYFLYRSTIVGKTPDGGLTGEVVDSTSTRITAQVQVPKEAVNWFLDIPTTYSGGAGYSIYARLSEDKFGAPIAVLLGRTVHSDANGSRIEW
jgi:hypothetical protein